MRTTREMRRCEKLEFLYVARLNVVFARQCNCFVAAFNPLSNRDCSSGREIIDSI